MSCNLFARVLNARVCLCCMGNREVVHETCTCCVRAVIDIKGARVILCVAIVLHLSAFVCYLVCVHVVCYVLGVVCVGVFVLSRVC